MGLSFGKPEVKREAKRVNLRFGNYSPLFSRTFADVNFHQLPKPRGHHPAPLLWLGALRRELGTRRGEGRTREPEDTSHPPGRAETGVGKRLGVPGGRASRSCARFNRGVCAGPRQPLLLSVS